MIPKKRWLKLELTVLAQKGVGESKSLKVKIFKLEAIVYDKNIR